jgi:hypothetical protein
MSIWHRRAMMASQQPQQSQEKFEATSPAHDPAPAILQNDHTMTDEGRATAWDMFHHAKDHLELAQRIQHVDMSNETRHALWLAKRATAPEVDPVAKTRKAIESVSQMDPATLSTAESHPEVLKILAGAAMPKGSKAKS